MSQVPLHALTATELVAGFASGAFTPLEALRAIHARIDALNPQLNAIIAEDRAAALASATASTGRWQRSAALSGLDGVPVTVKDNIHVAGLPASWGSQMHAGAMATVDEPAIALLRAAGCVFIGKTNVPEFALQGFTSNDVYGVTRNPVAPELTPGGSTGGGAAAVAAGFGPIAIGTDGGGSIRRPAAHCGLFGFKPSIGQIARSGGFPQILADFEVIGPVAQTLDDVALAFSAMALPDAADPRSRVSSAPSEPFSAPPRIAYAPRAGAHPVDASIVAATDTLVENLRDLGWPVEVIDAPFDPDTVHALWGTVARAGLSWHVSRHGGTGHIGAAARAMAAEGATISAADYLDALAGCQALRSEAGRFFARYDLLICPSAAALAWPAGEPFPPEIDGHSVGPRGHAVFTAWMNVAGLAALSVPIDVTETAGGIGAQLVAGAGRDRTLLDLVARHSNAFPTRSNPARTDQ